MTERVRYRFVGRCGDLYLWESALPISPGESHHEHVRCSVEWFWNAP